MRVPLTIALLLTSAALVSSAADQAPRVPQAPPIAATACDCPRTGVCPCDVCACPGGRPARLGYNAAHDSAKASGKVLVVWCNTACPPCEAALPDCLHCHVASLHGDGTPRVEVGVPEGGRLYKRGTLTGQVDAAAIRALLRPALASPVSYPPAPVYQPATSYQLGGFGSSVACVGRS